MKFGMLLLLRRTPNLVTKKNKKEMMIRIRSLYGMKCLKECYLIEKNQREKNRNKNETNQQTI